LREFGSAVILAGGKSKRMGFDKQLLTLNEKKLIYNISDKLRRKFDEIIVITNTPQIYSMSREVIYICDEIKNKGPLGGIYTGLKKATSQYVYFIACDMPVINFDYIDLLKLSVKAKSKDAVVTKQSQFIEPFNAFYNKKLIKELEICLKTSNDSVQRFLKSQDCIYIPEKTARKYSPDWEMFLNFNTKEDIIKWRKRK
jgi:molybdopterin-guanine dinucleotide biosynthesis protein A